MGTDIHLFTERRRPGQPWEPFVARVLPCWRVNHPDHSGSCYRCKGAGTEIGFSDRNYNAFAILADVRNGRGFAGCDTGDGFRFVAAPKGLPDDLSPDLRSLFEGEYTDEGYEVACERFGRYPGDHTASWLTLTELLAFPIDDMHTTCRGVVTRAQFDAWDGKSVPDSACGFISGNGITTITAKDALAGAPGSHVQISWTEGYREASGRLWDFVEGLRDLMAKEDYQPDDVRIVFNFDS